MPQSIWERPSTWDSDGEEVRILYLIKVLLVEGRVMVFKLGIMQLRAISRFQDEVLGTLESVLGISGIVTTIEIEKI